MSFAMAYATVVLAVTSFDASAAIIIVVDTRNGRALVTSADAVALLVATAAASLTARRQLTRVGIVRTHLGIYPHAGAPDAIIDAVALMNKAVGHIVETSFSRVDILMTPECASTAGVPRVVKLVLVVGRLGMALIVHMHFACVVNVGVLLIKLVGVDSITNGAGNSVLVTVVRVVVCCSIDVVGGASVSSRMFLSPPAVVALITQGDPRNDAFPEGLGRVGLPALNSSGAKRRGRVAEMARSLPLIALSFMASTVTGVLATFDLVRLSRAELRLFSLITVKIAAGTLHTALEVVDLLVRTG
jgi:hypothetical protein